MKVVVDSDALFAVYNANDSLHSKAKEILKRLGDDKNPLFATNLVLQEATALVSYRLGQSKAVDFIGRLRQSNLREFFLTPKLTSKTWCFFKKQTRKGISFIDCANIIVVKELKADSIFSFDSFYPKELRLK